MSMVADRRDGRFPAFRSPDYRRLFANAFFASASNWTMILARGWLIFELTDSAAWVGAATFAGMIPMLLVGPFGGAFADRTDRRLLAIYSNGVAIFAAASLAAIALADLVQPWHIVALAGVGGIGRAIGTPAEQALMPNLVQREHLLNAVALQGISRHGSRLAGPLLGAFILSAIGAGWVFLLSAVLLVLAIHQLWRIQYRPDKAAWATEAEKRAAAVSWSNIRKDLAEGLRYVERDRRLTIVMALVALHCGSTMAFDSMMPTLATTVGGADRTFSAILVGVGAGAIAGTLTVSMMREQVVQGRTLALVGFGSGVSMVVLGLAQHPVIAVAGGVLAGATQASYMALSATLVQQIVPDELRGRVMSIYVMLAAGHMAFVNFGFGWLADGIGVRVLLIVPGIFWMVIFLIAIVMLSEVRSIIRTGAFLPRPAALVPAPVEG